MNDAPLRLVGLRGATTCPANTATDIRHAASELIDALVSRNGIKPRDIVSVTFSVTADLDACFPAAEARQREGWDSVALLDVRPGRPLSLHPRPGSCLVAARPDAATPLPR
jgi:chorismate mutase